MTTTQTSSQTDRIIRVLGPESYRGMLHWVDAGDGHLSDVHVARYAVEQNTTVEAYSKIYPYQDGLNRGMVNEVTGYLICHALGIPQPRRAFLAYVPLRVICTAESSPFIRQLAETREFYPAFCTERLDGKSAAYQLPDTAFPGLIADVKAWEKLPATMAADDQMANVDRHLNNLIRTGKKSFAVIDNGILAAPTHNGIHHWKAEHLDAWGLFRNRLCEHIYEYQPPNRTISATLDHANKSPEAVDAVVDELKFWWSQLLTDDDYQSFMDFILQRTSQIEVLLRRRYNRLL